MRRTSMALVCLGFSSTIALADTDTHTVAAAEPAPAQPTVVVAPAPAPLPAPEPLGMRLRNGFSFSAGQEYGSGPSSGFSASLFGGDWRIGAQIDDLHAVYLHTHLSFGKGAIDGAEGYTGNFAAALIAERMLPMRFFVGGGGGYGVLNNPDGPLAQLRAGWYPFEQNSNTKVRRLNVALDGRWYFAGEQIGTVTHVALTVGYDRF